MDADPTQRRTTSRSVGLAILSVAVIGPSCLMNTPGIVHCSCVTCTWANIENLWRDGTVGGVCSALALLLAYWSKSQAVLRISRSAVLACVAMLGVSLGFIRHWW